MIGHVHVMKSWSTTTPPGGDSFKITVAVAPNETMVIPATGTNDFEIDWGDNSAVEQVTTASPSHIYTNNGNYQISITGIMTSFGFSWGGNCLNVISFDNWGDMGFESLYGGFAGCINMNCDIPLENISKLGTSLINGDYLFSNCTSLTGSIPVTFLNNCTSLTSMSDAFYACTSLTGLIPDTFLGNCVSLINIIDLFANCTGLTGSIPSTFLDNCILLTEVGSLFQGCLGLTGIPITFLNNSTGITSLSRVFSGCVGLSGDAPEYWLNPQYTDYGNCFYDCIQLNNYLSIPSGWK